VIYGGLSWVEASAVFEGLKRVGDGAPDGRPLPAVQLTPRARGLTIAVGAIACLGVGAAVVMHGRSTERALADLRRDLAREAQVGQTALAPAAAPAAATAPTAPTAATAATAATAPTAPIAPTPRTARTAPTAPTARASTMTAHLTRVSGNVPREVVERVVGRNLGRLQRCAAPAAAVNGAALAFAIDGTGAVVRPRASGPALGASTADCLTRAVGAMQFPAQAPGVATLVELRLAQRS
jgi:hypothetical protein